MAPSIFLASHTLISLILFHLLLSSVPVSTATKQTGIRVTLTRANSGNAWPKYTSTNQLQNDPSTSLIKSPVKAYKDLYIMSLAIGTPPVPFSAIMDTGSDLIWTKCQTTGSGLFNPSKSTSFSKLVNKSCYEFGLGTDCKQTYADGKSVSVSLGQETLKIGYNKLIKNLTFACGKPDKDIPYKGIIGMGRGELSLVSQLEQRVFSYCLGSRFDRNTRSVLLMGSKASIPNNDVQTMPLVEQENKPYYYISLVGISVGETRLAVTKSDFAISGNGEGGMIIDSGTTFAYLEQRIVDMISEEFVNQTKFVKYESDDKPYDLEHCFKYDQGYNNNKGKVPNVVFHFEGANWELKRGNYIYEMKGGKGGCLAFIASDYDDKVSIFGNMQQQNMMVVYDLDKKKLSFTPADCNRF